MIPSGRASSAAPCNDVADTGGGVPGMPPVPVPPGVNPQAMNALLIELAQRNAAAEALGMGNPYGSLLSVLQGSPQYKALIETATRGAGLPFVRQEAEEKAIGGYGVDIATRTYQATLDRVTKALEMEGTARLDPAEIKVADGKGGFVTLQGTREQKIKAANGLAVPELWHHRYNASGSVGRSDNTARTWNSRPAGARSTSSAGYGGHSTAGRVTCSNAGLSARLCGSHYQPPGEAPP